MSKMTAEKAMCPGVERQICGLGRFSVVVK